MRRVITAILLTLSAAPAGHAAGRFSAPAGCKVFATVQLRSCSVVQHYACNRDAPGDQWAAYQDGEGTFYLSRIDRETRWLESYDMTTGIADRLASERDPASFSTLLKDGRDDYDFATRDSEGTVTRYSGFDRLTGRTILIDGQKLERTSFELTARSEKGEFLWRRRGTQLISRAWRVFWAEQEQFENALGDRITTTDTPADFALPGEKGYLSTTPIYGCDAIMSAIPGETEPVSFGRAP
ncbi:MAG: hypothetical protein H6895_04745 [Defluviimonas sp.]|uniref:hypothetical protein n=1 Tax=Albidovulum sp. TaxID=1872424 RepID=UPI002A32B860|nr:hypothetical protein [Defluviimonas sp.]